MLSRGRSAARRVTKRVTKRVSNTGKKLGSLVKTDKKKPATQGDKPKKSSGYKETGRQVLILGRTHNVYEKGTKLYIKYEDGSYMSMRRAIKLNAQKKRGSERKAKRTSGKRASSGKRRRGGKRRSAKKAAKKAVVA